MNDMRASSTLGSVSGRCSGRLLGWQGRARHQIKRVSREEPSKPALADVAFLVEIVGGSARAAMSGNVGFGLGGCRGRRPIAGRPAAAGTLPVTPGTAGGWGCLPVLPGMGGGRGGLVVTRRRGARSCTS